MVEIKVFKIIMVFVSEEDLKSTSIVKLNKFMSHIVEGKDLLK